MKQDLTKISSMKRAALAGVLASLGVWQSANAAGYTVAATTDIWLASQPSGTVVTGYFGSDNAPDNTPVDVGVASGNVLTFSVSGTASVDGSCFAGPDGGCYADESGFSPAPASNTYKGPATALIGVFLGDGVTDVTHGPASLDYTDPTNTSAPSFTPALNQIFFIGDGLTGTGSGATQQFTAPAGATHLYLAVADSIGASTGNVGSFDVTVNGATPVVPEPQSLSLALMGLAVTTIGAYAQRRKK